MSVFSNNLLLGAAGQGGGAFDPTLIGNSVWFASGDYLTQDTAEANSSRKEAIFSTWLQRTSFGAQSIILGVNGSNANDYLILDFQADDTLRLLAYSTTILVTTQVFRDIGWYHILVTIDTSQNSNASQKIFVNGIEVTSFSTRNNFGSNADIAWGRNATHLVSSSPTSVGSDTMLGYMAQTALITDKSFQQSDYSITDFLDAFTFGTNGSQFTPKADADIATIAGTGGNNSFSFNFANSADLGNDTSGSNDFTATSMAAANQTTNTPSLVFPTFSALNISSLTSLSEGNLKAVGSGTEVSGVWATRPISAGETIYFEGTWGSTSGWGYFGVSSKSYHNEVTSTFNADSSTHIFQLTPTASNRGVASAGSALFTGKTTWTTTDTFQIAIDINNGKLWFGVNDSWYDSGGTTTGDPAAGTNPTVTFTAETPMFVVAQSGGASSINVNFGQDSQNVSTGNADENGEGDFEFAPPSGFLAFCSANLTAPDYQGIDYFNATLYTGNGTAIGSGGKAVTGVGFKPDFTWIKNRDAVDSHILTDVVRGVTKYISSDSAAAEVTNVESLSTFDTDGFTVGNLAAVNTNTEDYVSWNWLAGGTGSSNTDGSITSTVTVADAGHFSIGSYTGNSTDNSTVGHGLGGVPEMILVRNLSRLTYGLLWHKDGFANNGAGDVSTFVVDFARGINFASNNTKFGGTDETYPTANVFKIGNHNEINANTESLVFYAFRSIPGVCKVGSFVGNNSTDGPYVSLDFTPRWIMLKATSTTNPFIIFDTARNTTNPVTKYLLASSNAAEASTGRNIDFIADGIKLREDDSDMNGPYTYAYVAMADLGGNGTLPPIYGR